MRQTKRHQILIYLLPYDIFLFHFLAYLFPVNSAMNVPNEKGFD